MKDKLVGVDPEKIMYIRNNADKENRKWKNIAKLAGCSRQALDDLLKRKGMKGPGINEKIDQEIERLKNKRSK